MRQIRSRNGAGLMAGMAAAVVLSASAALAADPLCGDVNKSSTVSSSDALLVLKKGVGQSITLQCAAPSLILQTGQSSCYNAAGAVISCAGTGQDGETQRGVATSYIDNGDGTITDNKTGLMWEKLDNNNLPGLAGIHDWDNSYTWTNAFVKISQLNGSGFAGHADWRLPNVKELYTLTDNGRVSPAIDPVFHSVCTAGCTATTCGCTESDFYWSSSTYQPFPSEAWLVGFYDGDTLPSSKTGSYFVRAVRAGS